MNHLIEKYISVRPDICHGKPCFKGTRIMVYLVLEMLEQGGNLKEIREAYPRLNAKHIQAALHYASCVLREREFDPAFLQHYELSA